MDSDSAMHASVSNYFDATGRRQQLELMRREPPPIRSNPLAENSQDAARHDRS
jgi:hypothetical protein